MAEGDSNVKAEVTTISIVVRDQSGGEVHFKVKPHTKFAKVFDAYCTKKGVNTDQIKFLFDGQRVTKEQTPADLEMADDDIIDAVVEQLGGGHSFHAT